MTRKDTGELQQIDKFKTLAEISLKLNTILDLDPLLHTILEIAEELLECEAGSILLYNEEKDSLFFAAATGDQADQLDHVEVPLDESLAGTVFLNRQHILVNDVSQDRRHCHQIENRTDYSVCSLLGVPMSIRDQTIGVLEVVNKLQSGFTPRDVQILSVVASQAAVAINNARIVDELQQANRELRQADQLRNDFLAITSHELRTPLGLILGYASFLKEEVESELLEYANAVVNAALRMRTLVDDITDMNIIYSERVEIYPHPTSVQELIQKAYQEVEPMARTKDLAVIFEIPWQKIWVNVDSRLEKVFVNLLDNAVRFTDPPGIITVRVTTKDDQVHVAIEDSGVGIPPDSLERIFEQFYQVENHLIREHGGLGLGLPVARGLVTLHDGKIWADSAGPGKGSTFNVVLPTCTSETKD